mmetsp:Transcript_2034/g.3530  ORF Transcript_2034/g.3530 Transcript_2034/m.3530 type:complete len:160 (+) Transcript_2034:254-733(+)
MDTSTTKNEFSRLSFRINPLQVCFPNANAHMVAGDRPERDMMEGNGKEPRQMLRTRAIQIGLKGHMSDEYVNSVISIEDVTELAHAIGRAHSLDHKNKSRAKEAMVGLCDKLPNERPYLPHCSDAVLADLGMAPGDTAKAMHGLGLGKTTLNRSKSVGA